MGFRPWQCDARAALDMLPRFNNNSSWPITGKRTIFNSQLLPSRVQAAINKIMKQFDRSGFTSFVTWLDVSGDNVWFIQRTLRISHLQFLLRRGWEWQRWKKLSLPIYLRYKGRLIVWNGTHRTILVRLAKKRLRARVIDLDAFFVWKKSHSDKSQWNVRKRVKVRGKKRA